jgi:hypothetical protein
MNPLQMQAQGIVRCKHCRQVVLLAQRAAHAMDCAARKRAKKLDRVTFTKEGLSLHAIAAYRYKGRGRWEQEIHYVHAESVAHARAQFCYAEPNRKRVKIIDVGLALGWHVDEKTEKIIS